MTTDALLVLRALFSMIWRLFTSWYIPGTHTTPAAWAFFSLSTLLIFKFIKVVGGLSSEGKL